MLSMRQLHSTSEVIQALGGAAAVADLTGRDYKSVNRWQSSSKRFPSATYVMIQSALVAAGMSAPAALWGMTPSAQPSKKARAA